jgi:hypothetical protein
MKGNYQLVVKHISDGCGLSLSSTDDHQLSFYGAGCRPVHSVTVATHLIDGTAR